ncbi:MAG: two-component regulator propeller domain-containing protein [Bacteroidales bacterium]
MKRFILFFFFLFLFALGVFSQTIKKAQEPIANFTNFNTEQGLALSSISCAFMDSYGNLWFGTYGGGVSRYDGSTFFTYNNSHGLSHNTIWSISEDKLGNIWFGTDGGGANFYDGYSFSSITESDGLLHNTVWHITPDSNGDLWIATYGGINKLSLDYSSSAELKEDIKNLKIESYTTKQGLANNDVRHIHEDAKGNLWFGTFNGLSIYDGKYFTNYLKEDGLINDAIMCLFEDSNENIWIGTDGGISKVSNYNDKIIFTNYTNDNGLANNSIRAINEDFDGTLWFGTAGGGITYFENDIFTTITTRQGLAHNNIRSITRDKNGNLWFGTVGGGVSRYNGKAFTTYTTEQGLAHNRVFSVVEDNHGNLWFGTVGGGVSKFDGKYFTNYSTDDGLAHNSVYDIIQDSKGNMWFGTFGGGVSKFDGKRFKTYTTKNGLVHDRTWRITEDSNGNIWFGSFGGGVSKFDGDTFINYTAANGLAHNTIETIVEDHKGNIWFGTVGGGVSLLEKGTTVFKTFSIKNGIAHNRVRCITEDKNGFLWFGTDAGISRYDGKYFVSFTTEHGLPDGVVYDIVEDENGILWIGTNLGFSGLQFSDKNNNLIPAGKLQVNNKILINDYLPVWDTYNNKTGYSVKDINTNASCITKLNLPLSNKNNKNTIWAGCGDDRVIRFNPKAVKKINEPLVVVLQRIRINDERICWHTLNSVKGKETNPDVLFQNQVIIYGNRLSDEDIQLLSDKFSDVEFANITPFYQLPTNLVLPYRHNNITFEFNAIETGRNFLVNYQYKLEGQDKDWRPVTKNSFATYGNLHEGDYTFLLRAQSPEGVWNDAAAYSFKVLPPWYRKWWMFFAYGIGAFIIIWSIIIWRIRSLQNEKKHLEKVVKERTLELLEEKEEADKQRMLVEEKSIEIAKQHAQLSEHHKSIADSINYAQRLQQAILPSIKTLKKELKDVFIIYKPKEVVSGDFYWMEKSIINDDEIIFFAVADCTGHGVPGALISVVCSNALNSSFKEFNITDTGKLLDKVNTIVVETFEKSGMDIHEGMDIALCSINWKTKELQYSGARIALNIISSNGTNPEYNQVPATPKSIGKRKKETQKFTTNNIKLKDGDYIYISTDGLYDQFGGPNGEKFKAKQLKSIILNNLNKSLSEQKSIIETSLEKWKEDWGQVDDICVIAFRI